MFPRVVDVELAHQNHFDGEPVVVDVSLHFRTILNEDIFGIDFGYAITSNKFNAIKQTCVFVMRDARSNGSRYFNFIGESWT